VAQPGSCQWVYSSSFAEGVPENDVEDVASLLRGLCVSIVRFDCGSLRLATIEYASVHALVYTRAFEGNHSSGRRGSLGRLSVHPARHIFTTDGKIAGRNVWLPRSRMNLRWEGSKILLESVFLRRGALGCGLFGVSCRVRRPDGEEVVCMAEEQAEEEGDEGEAPEGVDEEESAECHHCYDRSRSSWRSNMVLNSAQPLERHGRVLPSSGTRNWSGGGGLLGDSGWRGRRWFYWAGSGL
jgi:hypothetical protein